ncbi:MAG: glycosyltransferase family 39 protein, partial [Elusimicrobia bacterium]|nr:glycosyltransferase family 39 protein [Elusimicrobiota bacterium]
MRAAPAVLAALLVDRASGFWGYLLRNPSSLDGTSVRLWVWWGLEPLLVAGLLGAISLGLGRRVRGALGVPERGFLDETASAALGLALLGQAVFLLGWAGGLRPLPLAVLVVAASVLAAGNAGGPSWTRPRWGPVEGAAAGALAFAAAATVLDALAPPALWDARAYHLALPELALKAGRFAPVPWLLHSHWPHVFEALYAVPLAAGRDTAAALVHWGTAVLLVGAVFAAARRAAGPSAGWTAALLLAAQPAFLKESGTAHTDAAAALLALGAALALVRWEEDPEPSCAAFAGLLAGGAAAAKLTLAAPLAAWTAVLLWKRRPRDAAAFAVAATAFLGPWLLKTWLETGDPVWPFLSRFTGDAAGAALAARNAVSNRWGAFPPPAWALTQDGPGFL